MGLRDSAKTPVVMSLSGWSTSMPTRKLLPKETKLSRNSNNPTMQRNTPTQERASESKNCCLLTMGKPNAAAKHDVEVEEGKWGDEEVLLVDLAEMHRPDPASSHQQGAGDRHSEQQHDGQ